MGQRFLAGIALVAAWGWLWLKATALLGGDDYLMLAFVSMLFLLVGLVGIPFAAAYGAAKPRVAFILIGCLFAANLAISAVQDERRADRTAREAQEDREFDARFRAEEAQRERDEASAERLAEKAERRRLRREVSRQRRLTPTITWKRSSRTCPRLTVTDGVLTYRLRRLGVENLGCSDARRIARRWMRDADTLNFRCARTQHQEVPTAYGLSGTTSYVCEHEAGASVSFSYDF